MTRYSKVTVTLLKLHRLFAPSPGPNAHATHKRRHTAKGIFNRLREKYKFAGGHRSG